MAAKVLRVMTTFSTTVDGVPRMYYEGQIISSDDPAVKASARGREDYFMDATKFAEREAGIETATAAPGERRSLTRAAAKRAAKKTAEPTDPETDTQPSDTQQSDTQKEN